VSIADDLAAPVPGSPYAHATRDRAVVEVDLTPSGGMVARGILSETVTADEGHWRQLAQDNGLTVPDGWIVRLTKARHNQAAWTRDREDIGRPNTAYRAPAWVLEFAIDPPGAVADRADIDALFRQIRRDKAKPRPLGDGAFVVSFNDWQLYKAEGDGFEGTVRRICEGIDAAQDRVRSLRRDKRSLGSLVVVGNGDIVEGCEIFPNQAYQLSGDLRDQMNAARRLIVHGVRTLAPLFDQVKVVAVGGNHGENRRGGKPINRHDNLDAAVFEQAAEVIGGNEAAYGHVSWAIPRDDLTAVVEAGGHLLGITHGHLARASGGTEAKLHGWYDRMAGDKQPIGQVDVLLTAHYHHERTADWGGCHWVQATTVDGGSAHHEQSFGGGGRRGITTFAMYPDRRFYDLLTL
jgi:hypothetical protein